MPCRDDFQASLVAKAGAYKLLRIMYLTLPPAEIKDHILKAFGGNGVSSCCNFRSIHWRPRGRGGGALSLVKHLPALVIMSIIHRSRSLTIFLPCELQPLGWMV